MADVSSLGKIQKALLTRLSSYDSFKVFLGLPTTGGH